MFVQTNGSLEPDAIAAAIASDVIGRAAEAIVITIQHLDEDGRELNEIQKHMLVRTAMRCFDGTEAEIRAELDRAIEWANRDAATPLRSVDA